MPYPHLLIAGKCYHACTLPGCHEKEGISRINQGNYSPSGRWQGKQRGWPCIFHVLCPHQEQGVSTPCSTFYRQRKAIPRPFSKLSSVATFLHPDFPHPWFIASFSLARGFSFSSISAIHHQHPLVSKPWLMLLN